MAINAYEGGQMPLYMRLPKRGFNKPNRKDFAVINLGLIQKFVDAGKLDAAAAITRRRWSTSGLVRRKLDGMRVLGKGELTAKLSDDASPAPRSRPSRRSRRPAARSRSPAAGHGRVMPRAGMRLVAAAAAAA